MTFDVRFGSLAGALGQPEAAVPIARVHTSYVQVDPKTKQPAKAIFDVPLFQGWPKFMTDLLTYRGILVNNAWVPERMIELIIVNPESGGLPETMAEASNVVLLRPVTPPAQPQPASPPPAPEGAGPDHPSPA